MFHVGDLFNGEDEAGGSEVHGHPLLLGELEVSLGYTRPQLNPSFPLKKSITTQKTPKLDDFSGKLYKGF